MTTEPTALAGRVAADLMLREPKTLPGSATVGDVREALANPKLQLVLLADGTTFRGAVTQIPDSAPPGEPALLYADSNPETIAPTEPADVAFERTAASPHRRMIVLGDDDALLGLLCLDVTRTRFCQTSSSR